MQPNQLNSPDALCAEILAAARHESNERRHRAETEAASLLAAAGTEAEKLRRETIGQAQAKARRRKELIMATVTVEKRRMRSAQIEEMLESIREEIRKYLASQNGDSRETVIALALEAVGKIPANDLIVKISAADHAAFGNGLAEEIIRQARRPELHIAITPDAAMTGGDVTIQNAAGFQRWDNRLRPRLERLWPELRRQIAMAGGLITDNHSNGETV